MNIINHILSIKQPAIFKQFLRILRRPIPSVEVPLCPEEAIRLGYRMGLQEGYEEGLLAGLDLGVDINTTLAMSPSISTPAPWDIN